MTTTIFVHVTIVLFTQTDDMRREALKIELSDKLNELEQKMRKAMAWKVTLNYISIAGNFSRS